MTPLADGPRIVYPDEQPWAWFTMPMLMWALAILAAVALAGFVMGAWALRRTRPGEPAAPEPTELPPLAPTEPMEAVKADGLVRLEKLANGGRPTPHKRVDPAEEAWRARFGLSHVADD